MDGPRWSDHVAAVDMVCTGACSEQLACLDEGSNVHTSFASSAGIP